ncbi:M28 family peptidase [Flavobacterium caeni]|uniref:Peptidase family M28 n=1 Tax=Flavobacterium caeni TaxID=490189 RepID=A0A1G5DZI4_9FLAO|nr:M28 family peptidase [Flavobacterium caeni]SCY20152.1 Peptidase family M28 [Flavobacterium caeni]
MKKNDYSFFSAVIILILLGVLYVTLMPRWNASTEGPLSEFSAARAMRHIKEMAKAPHYVGSENHKNVAAYLEKELQQLGLETTTQQGTTLTDWGNLVHSKNILARIKGSGRGKALLLLSHYDSAPHSASLGASDDASGVATILEGVRAFLHNKTPHQNDIIIVFTDAEELGLNGAALFVTEHAWAKEIGVALNFEARGTAGPGYMLMEVNRGNAQMVEAFAAAGVSHPVSNSLMYSIYKMMPNDTDLTVLRSYGNIPGFNFAFIDDHFNYHTAQDDYAHLRPETIAHQGSYLMPLLKHLSSTDLSQLDTQGDRVYFNTPLGFFHYPFAWNVPLLVIAAVLFVFFVFIGLGKRTLHLPEIFKGFLPLLGAVVLAGALAFFGWKLLRGIYPQYDDILQGFTYNGHAYIGAFVLLSVSVCFLCYAKTKTEAQISNQAVAPLLLWILLNLALVLFLPGAGFFILPVLFGLLMLGYYVVTQKINPWINLLLGVPALFILAPFIVMFPIGLGLKILAGSAVLTVLLFALLLPVFATFSRKLLWTFVTFLCAVGCLVYAHLNADYAPGKAKPNSLLYVYDADKEKADWATYDQNLDEWTKIYLGDNPTGAGHLNHLSLFSKYGSKFTYANNAMVRDIPEPTVEFLKDSVVGKYRWVKIKITPNRKVNRYDIFANERMVLHNLKANGAQDLEQKGSQFRRKDNKLLSYYVVDNAPLVFEFMTPKATALDLQLMESSFDLTTNPEFAMEKRKNWMIPTPFVLNDAVVLIKKIKPAPKVAIAVPVPKNFSYQANATRDTIPDPDAMPEAMTP